MALISNNEKLLLELFKLKKIVPRKKRGGTKFVSYSDVVWFLLDHYKEFKEEKNGD